ncbi:MAG TPA: urease accessory protein UreF [Puia sp.]|nr:urease accessory protein UreF [Puia sp.]
MSLSLLSLLQLSDPALPIGGYAHSGGLETYVQEGVVCDVGSATRFVRDMLSTNLHYTDAALVGLAYGAEMVRLEELDQLCEAVRMPKEIREASRKLGTRLLKVFDKVCVAGYRPRHYAVAFGYVAGRLEVGLREALTGFYYNAAAGMVTNCVKLIPIGQQDGQDLLFGLQPLIAELVEKSLEPDVEMIGLCCPGLDIKCMQHERLYSRLYMS